MKGPPAGGETCTVPPGKVFSESLRKEKGNSKGRVRLGGQGRSPFSGALREKKTTKKQKGGGGAIGEKGGAPGKCRRGHFISIGKKPTSEEEVGNLLRVKNRILGQPLIRHF